MAIIGKDGEGQSTWTATLQLRWMQPCSYPFGQPVALPGIPAKLQQKWICTSGEDAGKSEWCDVEAVYEDRR